MEKLTLVNFSSLFSNFLHTPHKLNVYAPNSYPCKVAGIRFTLGLISLSRGYP
ncbi:hypothetical protein [Pedobacter sp. UBA5917]|uniref:hypothetical protein n=1 Tax=Pedobacter sp. UBA5917 TaxID=1947061 RepID=UPI0025F8B740|nr:hypothetical protein [Pedobacter sp. UBA5917]